MNHKKISKGTILFAVASILCLGAGAVFADVKTLGDVAHQVTGSFQALAKLITATAYIAGLGFAVGAILKFKQHKDNPTQIPIGTPVALLFIAAALIFLPTLFGITGETLFGTAKKVGGPSGYIFTGS